MNGQTPRTLQLEANQRPQQSLDASYKALVDAWEQEAQHWKKKYTEYQAVKARQAALERSSRHLQVERDSVECQDDPKQVVVHNGVHIQQRLGEVIETNGLSVNRQRSLARRLRYAAYSAKFATMFKETEGFTCCALDQFLGYRTIPNFVIVDGELLVGNSENTAVRAKIKLGPEVLQSYILTTFRNNIVAVVNTFKDEKFQALKEKYPFGAKVDAKISFSDLTNEITFFADDDNYHVLTDPAGHLSSVSENHVILDDVDKYNSYITDALRLLDAAINAAKTEDVIDLFENPVANAVRSALEFLLKASLQLEKIDSRAAETQVEALGKMSRDSVEGVGDKPKAPMYCVLFDLVTKGHHDVLFDRLKTTRSRATAKETGDKFAETKRKAANWFTSFTSPKKAPVERSEECGMSRAQDFTASSIDNITNSLVVNQDRSGADAVDSVIVCVQRLKKTDSDGLQAGDEKMRELTHHLVDRAVKDEGLAPVLFEADEQTDTKTRTLAYYDKQIGRVGERVEQLQSEIDAFARSQESRFKQLLKVIAAAKKEYKRRGDVRKTNHKTRFFCYWGSELTKIDSLALELGEVYPDYPKAAEMVKNFILAQRSMAPDSFIRIFMAQLYNSNFFNASVPEADVEEQEAEVEDQQQDVSPPSLEQIVARSFLQDVNTTMALSWWKHFFCGKSETCAMAQSNITQLFTKDITASEVAAEAKKQAEKALAEEDHLTISCSA